jgi:hypothetical protein
MLRGEIEKVGAVTRRQLEVSLLAILVVVLVKVSLLALKKAQFLASRRRCRKLPTRWPSLQLGAQPVFGAAARVHYVSSARLARARRRSRSQ